jgi:hypothetical protein
VTPLARHAALVSALVLAGYLAVGRAVGNLYPFSTFEMYAAERPSSASRVFARDAAGAVHEVFDFARWRCDATAESPIDPMTCRAEWPFEYVPAQDREAAAWIAEHPGPDGGEAVELVRRVWRLPDRAGAPPSVDCLLARCRVER